MPHPLRSSFAVLALVAALAACNRDDQQRPQAATAGSQPDSASGEVAQYALMKNSIGWLTDSNIVALAIQVNDAVPAIARLEAQSWASEPLRALATGEMREHAAFRAAIDSVAGLRRIPAQAPAVAPSMIAPYDSLLATQVGLPLAERESKLIEMLLAVHAKSTVDFGALAGNATDPDLRAVLANRGVLMEQAHAARAKLIQGAMQRADSARQDSAKTTKPGGRRR
jgi:hypothetical protein